MTVGPQGSRRGGWQFTEWLLGILGGIATFLGFFVFFGPEDEYVGIGGDLSWRVADISSAVAYTLTIGGIALLVAALFMVVMGRRRFGTAEPLPSSPRTELLTHTGVFVIVNAFIWLQDIAIGEGVNYAYWVTIPWAVGLGAHAMAYVSSKRRASEATTPEPRKELLRH